MPQFMLEVRASGTLNSTRKNLAQHQPGHWKPGRVDGSSKMMENPLEAESSATALCPTDLCEICGRAVSFYMRKEEDVLSSLSSQI